MSNQDDKDFAIRAPYIQRIAELEAESKRLSSEFGMSQNNQAILIRDGEVRIATLKAELEGKELHRECQWQLDAEIVRRVAAEKLAVSEYQRGRADAEREAMEQEPVAWIDPNDIPLYRESGEIYVTNSNFDGNTTPLYLKPFPAQKPLSNPDMYKMWSTTINKDCFGDFCIRVRNIEAAHGITEKE